MSEAGQNARSSNSVITFNCTSCGRQIRVPSIHAGKKGKCPQCKNVVVVPQSTHAPLSPSTPQEDEPIRLKRDSDQPSDPSRPTCPSPQQWHRSGPEPPTDVVADADKFAPSPEQKPATLVDMFAFPFSLAGILHFLFFWSGPLILMLFQRIFAFACCYGQVLVIGLYIALFGYFYYYLFNCVITAAKDERAAPDVSLDNLPSFFDLLGRVLLVFGCTVICFGPAILYVVFFYILSVPLMGGNAELANWRIDPLYWTLYGLGVFFFPMFLLATALFDSITALNPFLIIGSIVSTFAPYCFLAVLFCAIGLLMNFVGQWRTSWLLLLFAWGIDVYLMFIAAYILGRFFRRYENKLNWEVKL